MIRAKSKPPTASSRPDKRRRPTPPAGTEAVPEQEGSRPAPVRGSGRGSQTASWAGRNGLHWLAGGSWFFGTPITVHHVGERVVQLRHPTTGQAVRQHPLEPGRGGGPARSARIRGGPGQLVSAVLVSALCLCPAGLAHDRGCTRPDPGVLPPAAGGGLLAEGGPAAGPVPV